MKNNALGILNDSSIKFLAEEYSMIMPFVDHLTDVGRISYGLSSYGYDIRVGSSFKIFNNINNVEIDPKNFNNRIFVDIEATEDGWVTIPPNSFALAGSVEKFKIPRDIMTITVGKSTYARCGIITNVTPLEPGWEGYVTLEISNTTPCPARIYANEGIAQCLFFRAEQSPSISYDERNGKYQDQGRIQVPIVNY